MTGPTYLVRGQNECVPFLSVYLSLLIGKRSKPELTRPKAGNIELDDPHPSLRRRNNVLENFFLRC